MIASPLRRAPGRQVSGSRWRNERWGKGEGVVRVTGHRSGRLVLDIRGFEPSLRRAVVFCVVDKLAALGSEDELVLVCDHEPAGLGYQIDLRRESRGLFEFSFDRRSDGAWVALLRPRRDRLRSQSAE